MLDASTNLVQAYLHVNGYFTATEYPLVETSRGRPARNLTDIDMLAVRFGRESNATRSNAKRRQNIVGPLVTETDRALNCPDDRIDMIVAEVKQGRAEVNSAARERKTLNAALRRFGCCSAEQAPNLVHNLLQHGRVNTDHGHTIRMVVFASRGERAPRGWHWVHLDHIFYFLDQYLKEEGRLLNTTNFQDPALGWLSLLHKCRISLQTEGNGS